jgi:hypothetical protein
VLLKTAHSKILTDSEEKSTYAQDPGPKANRQDAKTAKPEQESTTKAQRHEED